MQKCTMHVILEEKKILLPLHQFLNVTVVNILAWYFRFRSMSPWSVDIFIYGYLSRKNSICTHCYEHNLVFFLWVSTEGLPDHIIRVVLLFLHLYMNCFLWPLKGPYIATWIHQKFCNVNVTKIGHGGFYFLQMLSQGNIS